MQCKCLFQRAVPKCPLGNRVPNLRACCYACAVTPTNTSVVTPTNTSVVTQVLGKPFGEVMAQMRGEHNDFHVGDVVYHSKAQNASYQLPGEAGSVFLSIAPNPSHLEAGRELSAWEGLGSSLCICMSSSLPVCLLYPDGPRSVFPAGPFAPSFLARKQLRSPQRHQ